MICHGENAKPIKANKEHDLVLIKAISKAFKWSEMLENGEAKSIKELAEREGVDRTYMGDLLKLKSISPEIITMIVNAKQPMTVNLSKLMHQKFPAEWERQKAFLDIKKGL